MKRKHIIAAAVFLASSVSAGPASASESMRILTYPTGLVVGELEVKADLGPQGRPAALYLDGRRACSMSAEVTACTVDLGPDPHVHLLELVREDGGLAEPDRVERWVNRPGQEAEVQLIPMPPTDTSPTRVCGARLDWAHPEHQDPAEIRAFLDGRQLTVQPGSSVRFPCPAEGASQVLTASAVFPDGRRVESVVVTGGFSGETSVELTAVPLTAETEEASPCRAPAASSATNPWPVEARTVPDSGYEVVFVLDPKVAYRPILVSGWHISSLAGGGFAEREGSLPGGGQTGRAEVGSEKDPRKPKPSWQKAKASLADAERLWYVAPDSQLHRVNGLAAGRDRWLDLLFKFGMAEIPDPPRIADAVAASGLVAAAGPRRRAVVLILGDKVSERDGSRFTPRQAREYLAEVQVPLVVLRNGKLRNDGWPAGLKTSDMTAMARHFEVVGEVLDRQCMAWFPSSMLPDGLPEMLPAGVRLAGRGEEAPASSQAVWARAEIEPPEPLPAEETLIAERLDITAVTVLLSAVDAGGRPVSDLAPEELEVLEDAGPVEVLALTPLAPTASDQVPAEPMADETVAPAPSDSAGELPVAVYVNRILGGGSDLRRALRAVAGEARRLTSLGPVEIVVADQDQIDSIVAPTRDAAAVAAALEELTSQRAGRHAIERIRQNFIRGVQPSAFRGNDNRPGRSKVLIAATAAAGEENIVLSRSLEQLRKWALRAAGHRTGLLVVVGGGFDDDPIPFYLPFIERAEPHNTNLARQDLRHRRQSDRVGALGHELAGAGWRMLAVAGEAVASTTGGAELARRDKTQAFKTLGAGTRHDGEDSAWLMVDPIGSQRHLAAPSGGDVTVGSAGLRATLDSTTGWYLLTYQVARPPDGTTHTLEVRPRRPGVEARTNRVVTAATSEGQAEARAQRLFDGSADRGELAVELTLGTPAPADGGRLTTEVEATVRFASLAPVVNRDGRGAQLRISVAVTVAGESPTTEHRRQQLAAVPETWVYAFPLEWPSAGESSLAVTVEDLASGLWGAAVAQLPSSP